MNLNHIIPLSPNFNSYPKSQNSSLSSSTLSCFNSIKPSFSQYPFHVDYKQRATLVGSPSLELLPPLLANPKVFEILKKGEIGGNTFVDVSGGFFILNCIAKNADHCEKTPKGVIILNGSSRIEKFWKDVTSIIIKTEKRKDAIRHIKILLADQASTYFEGNPKEAMTLALSSISALMHDISSKTSWLCKTKKYTIVKEIFELKRFHYICKDLIESESVPLMIKQLKSTSSSIHTLYLSNRYFLEKSRGQLIDFQAFVWNLQPFMTSTTLVQMNNDSENEWIHTQNLSGDRLQAFFHGDDSKPLAIEKEKQAYQKSRKPRHLPPLLIEKMRAAEAKLGKQGSFSSLKENSPTSITQNSFSEVNEIIDSHRSPGKSMHRRALSSIMEESLIEEA